MLVIGHRGGAGLAPENTIEALQAGFDAGADILEFDVRITKDGVPILCHNARLNGKRVNQTTVKALQNAGEVTLLKDVLDIFFGRILLNLEFKPAKEAEIVYTLLNSRYIKQPQDWDNLLISSFHVRSLLQFRRLSEQVNLALLHSINPFAFVTYQRRLRLSAVGWHRLHVNKLAIEIAQKSGLFTYVYTINRPQAAAIMEKRGIDGIVTDYPDRLNKLPKR